jgi:uncharacterized protein YjbI with pentapeptide repeats
METLTAFVRERTRQMEEKRNSTPFEQRVAMRAYFLWENAGQPEGRSDEFRTQADIEGKLGEPPATDIAAVLTAIKRRSEESRELETSKRWRLDFGTAVLRRAYLEGAHLERALFWHADLDGADLRNTHPEDANLMGAHLDGTDLSDAHLERANLGGAHLKGTWLANSDLEDAYLRGAHLERARFWRAHLDGADLRNAHLEGVDLSYTTGLVAWWIDDAHGDARTRLPDYVARPAHWPPEEPEETVALPPTA